MCVFPLGGVAEHLDSWSSKIVYKAHFARVAGSLENILRKIHNLHALIMRLTIGPSGAILTQVLTSVMFK